MEECPSARYIYSFSNHCGLNISATNTSAPCAHHSKYFCMHTHLKMQTHRQNQTVKHVPNDRRKIVGQSTAQREASNVILHGEQVLLHVCYSCAHSHLFEISHFSHENFCAYTQTDNFDVCFECLLFQWLLQTVCAFFCPRT